MSIYDTGVLALCAGAAFFDIRTWKIPNVWLICFAAAGFCCRALSVEGAEAADGILGMLIPLLLLGWLFCFRMMGAGDIKLLSVTGIWIGCESIWMCLLFTFIAAAAAAIIKMAVMRNAKERFSYLVRYIKGTVIARQKQDYMTEADKAHGIHVAVPVALAVVLKVLGVYA